jgi:uncharacterized protein YutE (UPF0331/DUF86 family)
MVNIEIVKRKLKKLNSYLNELAFYENITWEKYLDNFQNKRVIERLLQLIVDTAVDINSHTVVDSGSPPPCDSFNSFFEAAKLGMFSSDFAREIAPSTGLRNIIVHEYEQIDDALVYNSIKETLYMYKEYLKYVLKYCEKKRI